MVKIKIIKIDLSKMALWSSWPMSLLGLFWPISMICTMNVEKEVFVINRFIDIVTICKKWKTWKGSPQWKLHGCFWENTICFDSYAMGIKSHNMKKLITTLCSQIMNGNKGLHIYENCREIFTTTIWRKPKNECNHNLIRVVHRVKIL